MLPMSEATAMVVAKTPAPTVETRRPVLGALLATDVVSSINVPPFRASIKDGYAVVASDGVGTFPLAGTLAAGMAPDAVVLTKGHVCRVTTGSAVPDGADAVVQVEDTTLVTFDAGTDTELTIHIGKAASGVGQDIRKIGCDIAVGDVVLAAGTCLGPAELGLLASVGASLVPTYRPPVIGILSTGNELDGPSLGSIYDSNRPMLLNAILRTFGPHAAVAVDLGVCPDDAAVTADTLQRALRRCDIVVSSGGVSMGEHDLLKSSICSIGGTIHFGRVHMKPGKPTTFATLPSGQVWVGLPGNPVSAIVCFYLFVVPVVRRLMGCAEPDCHLPVVRATYVGTPPLYLDVERPEYHRCHLRLAGDKGLVVTSTGQQASHRLLSLHTANGLMVLPCKTPEHPEVTTGCSVDVVVIDAIAF